MSENGEIYTAGKNFTLPPGLTGWTNSTSGPIIRSTEGALCLHYKLQLLHYEKVPTDFYPDDFSPVLNDMAKYE